MNPLIRKARKYALDAHEGIDQRRRYTREPYIVHPEAVAKRVEEAGGDAEMIAAAWLHDAVEDTPVTLKDIEREFGPSVMELVSDLTNVSRQPDGNRAVRKAIDLRHTASASTRAKTIKLADLIDNAQDIAEHDPGFARIYLKEMKDLLTILSDGNPELLRQAVETLQRCEGRLRVEDGATDATPAMTQKKSLYIRMRRLFAEGFSAADVAEPLAFFESGQDAGHVSNILKRMEADVAGVLDDGIPIGYVRPEDLGPGRIRDFVRPFEGAQVHPQAASLDVVIACLTRWEHCFVTFLGRVDAVVSRWDMHKPPVRMWLFGMATIIEMYLVRAIEEAYPGASWRDLVTPGRLKKAEALLEERRRRREHPRLIDCLQLSDKAQILIRDPVMRRDFGFSSSGEAKRAAKELESLRNNLAHAQDIITNNWPGIVVMAERWEKILTRL